MEIMNAATNCIPANDHRRRLRADLYEIEIDLISSAY